MLSELYTTSAVRHTFPQEKVVALKILLEGQLRASTRTTQNSCHQR